MGEYFNSRPSARGDQQIAEGKLNALISIHAPPRGATWGAKKYASQDVFQFTPLREGRLQKNIFAEPAFAISIHAPPRGATRKNARGLSSTTFQFTPLREGRPKKISENPLTMYFNSRPSARGDIIKRLRSGRFPISIHAPPRGATGVSRRKHARKQFQFTPLREGRQRALARLLRRTIFQFTPLREGRRNVSCNRNWKLYFNSRPSARGDCCFQIGKPGIDNFNSRPSARGDHLRSGQSCLP